MDKECHLGTVIKSEVIVDENWFLSDMIIRIVCHIKFLFFTFFGIELVITAKNFSDQCIPNGISEDGKMKFKEIWKGEILP